MSKFLKLLEQSEPTDEVHHNPDEAFFVAIEKLCSALKIPCEHTEQGLIIKRIPDEDQEASASAFLAAVPGDQATTDKLKSTKKRVADTVINWANKLVSNISKSSV